MPLSSLPTIVRSCLSCVQIMATTAATVVGVFALHAQAPAEPASTFQDVIFTGGTTIRDTAGRDWAYLIWQADKLERLAGGAVAIYAKPGDASSASAYVRRSIVRDQADPLALQALINTAAHLGEDQNELRSQLNSLFQARFNGSSLSLAERLSAALRAGADPETRDSLEFLARNHPSVAMAIGQAFATPIEGGKTTFEVRIWDPQAKQDLTVIGRVTVTAGQPEVLPPPGPPIQVPDTSPQGHLNARFRWGTPSLLNQLSLFQHGFNLYRIPAAVAERNQFHVQPPPSAMLRQMVAAGDAVQVNRLPILADEELTQEEAANLNPTQGGDAETYFITDNNRRFEAAGVPFHNGDRFYYFVTARDLLGRDGYSSLGTLVTICDRVPPPLPRGMKVRNEHVFENGVGANFLQLAWNPIRDAETGTNIVYRVYRWDDPKQLQVYGRFSATNWIGSVSPNSSCPDCQLLFTDRASTAPPIPGKTYWYTLRVEDRGACGGNLSAHTAPVPGVLRDFTPAVTPTGQVRIRCGSPVASFKNTSLEDTGGKNVLDPAYAYYQLHCTADDPRIEWVDWFVSFEGARQFLARQYFDAGNSNVVFQYRFRRVDSEKVLSQKFSCEAGTADGKVSTPAEAQFQGVARTTEVRHANFTATYSVQLLVAGGNCRHDPLPGLRLEDPWAPIEAEFIPPPQSQHGLLEWKLYRQVDADPMTLIAQGTNAALNAVPVVFRDMALPVHDATVCYFVRYVNHDANSSSLHRLACAQVRGTAPLPVPTLAAIEPAGTSQSPRMRLRWFCPPYGVERFELRLSADTVLPASLGQQLSTNLLVTTSGSPSSRQGRYRTGRVAGDFMPGPVYTIDVPVALGTSYRVTVRAVSLGNHGGGPSNAEEFTWRNVPTSGVATPWPARGLPAVNTDFNNSLATTPFPGNIPPLGVAAVLFPATNGFSPAGIRIGEVLQVDVNSKGELYMNADQDPLSYVYQTTNSVSLCPFVLYRTQLTNENFPRVSGDLAQVSPLIENIAYGRGTWNGVDVTFLRDPFITVLPSATYPGRPQLVLRDTQPVIAGARYQYMLVHFGGNGEPDMVIPTNPVELPSREPAL